MVCNFIFFLGIIWAGLLLGHPILWCVACFFLRSKVSSPPLLTQNGASHHGCYPFKYEISNQHTKTAQTIQKEDDFREKCQNRQKSEEFRSAIKKSGRFWKIRMVWQRWMIVCSCSICCQNPTWWKYPEANCFSLAILSTARQSCVAVYGRPDERIFRWHPGPLCQSSSSHHGKVFGKCVHNHVHSFAPTRETGF